MPAKQEVEAFFSHLKRKDFKATPQRMRIAEAVFDTHRHFTADELYKMVKKREPLVGRVTVYRTLSHLVESGMVEELSMEKGVATYEHTSGHAHHDHLICLNCQKVEEVRSDDLEKAKRAEASAKGFTMVSHSLKIYGYCPECQKKKGGN
jgi:Fur family ferric uptake transcriptional regulator